MLRVFSNVNRLLSAVCGTFFLLTGGCATPYLQARKTDLMQSFHVGVCASKTPGISANVSASLVGSNVGFFKGTCVGNNYGHATQWQHHESGFVIGGDIYEAEFDRPFSIRHMGDFGYDMDGEEYVYRKDFFFYGLHGS